MALAEALDNLRRELQAAREILDRFRAVASDAPPLAGSALASAVKSVKCRTRPHYLAQRDMEIADDYLGRIEEMMQAVQNTRQAIATDHGRASAVDQLAKCNQIHTHLQREARQYFSKRRRVELKQLVCESARSPAESDPAWEVWLSELNYHSNQYLPALAEVGATLLVTWHEVADGGIARSGERLLCQQNVYVKE